MMLLILLFSFTANTVSGTNQHNNNDDITSSEITLTPLVTAPNDYYVFRTALVADYEFYLLHGLKLKII
ncbi:MAG: hypothetical protein GPJ54_05380 [Candidatus Heimdallarchaeota archaeon]|nr:hypothetical protein [Candidatus Heimdallarchaeota archaeon]